MTYTPKTRPYKHQLEYLRRANGRAAYALLCDMGTGKTKMILDEFGALVSAGQIDFMMVTSGKGNYRTWEGEIRRHLPDSLDALVYTWTGADNIRSRTLQREFLAERTRPRILLVNIEGIGSSDRCLTFVRQCLATSRKREIVVDESPLIKNHEAVRTIRMVQLGRTSEIRRIASGNPTPNSPMDLWGQFEFLGGSLLGHRSFYSFRARYAVLQDVHIGNGRTRKVMIAPKNLGELSNVVGAHAYRVRKEECLDLPPKIYQIREVEFHPDQRRMYEEMKKLATTQLTEIGDIVSAEVVIAQLSKMHQILCGQVYTEEGGVLEIPNNRLDAMVEVIAESGRQTIVWCAYKPNIRAVAQRLRSEFGEQSVVTYFGETSSDERQEAIRRFQAGEAHVFVGTAATGGRGLTLTAAKTVVYYSNDWDLDHRLQTEDRCHRIGQTDSVNYVDLMIRGTMDGKLVEALRRKIDVAAEIMGDGYREWLV